jgi:AAA+ superfamily predicted ATPase/adenylate kinase family enzyme
MNQTKEESKKQHKQQNKQPGEGQNTEAGRPSFDTRLEAAGQALNAQFVGQKDYFNALGTFFKNHREGGTVLVSGEPNTFKKVGAKAFMEALFGEVPVELDMSNYDFTLGYNAFLTDFYNERNHHLIFNNIQKADSAMLEVMSQMLPGHTMTLAHPYVLNNGFLTDSEPGANVDAEKRIQKIECPKRYYFFIYDDSEEHSESHSENQYGDSYDWIQALLAHVDVALKTRPLTPAEKREAKERVILKVLRDIEKEFDVEIVFDRHDSGRRGEVYGLYDYGYKFHEHEHFTLMDYMLYKVGQPLREILEGTGIDPKMVITLFIEKNEVYVRVKDRPYRLSDYAKPLLAEVKYRLDMTVGLESFKAFVKNIENNYKLQAIRERMGMRKLSLSLNAIFSGNAGAGKSEAAKILSEFLFALGAVSKNRFVETSKSDFFQGSARETAEATKRIVRSAMGGVLLIDGIDAMFSDEIGRAFWTALQDEIEEDIVVILSGKWSRSGMASSAMEELVTKFPNRIEFRDYLPEEMYALALQIAHEKGYDIAPEVKKDLIELFARNQVTEKKGLGNARFVRNVIDKAIADANRKYLENPMVHSDVLDRNNFNFNFSVDFNLEAHLARIIGLDEVKALLRAQYKLLIAQEKRRSVGVETKIDQNLNMVFAGNPGTGKTSIARLVADMFNSMGFLKTGQLIETDRSGFVGENSSETAQKTHAKFHEALGGILFIDEAYTLAVDALGREAIDLLLKLIEDHSSEVIVILAGYEEEMEDFFDVNIGLRSRFPLWTHFSDYGPQELMHMGVALIRSRGFKLSRNAESELKRVFEDIYENSDTQSGNGRLVRNLIETLIRVQSIRIAEEQVSAYEMNLITLSDVNKLVFTGSDSFDLEKALDGIVGNVQAKQFLSAQYKVFKMHERRRKYGLQTDLNKYMNVVFTGEMGTGRQKIITVLAEMLFDMGLMKSKAPFEIASEEITQALIGGKTVEDILGRGIGRVIFIDKADAFSAYPAFNQLMSELIKFIDRYRNRLYLILNGDAEAMKVLMKQYPPLAYRFPTWIHFDNYDLNTMLALAESQLAKAGFIYDDKVKEALRQTFEEFSEHKFLMIKNALLVNQFVDQVVRRQSIRVFDICELDGKSKNGKDVLTTLEVEDVEHAKKQFLTQNT